MKKNTINIEQLFQELVSQDSSFASQKKEILGLITRMTQHTPSVSIDPLFQNNLKSRLEHHIAYINNLKANPPQVNPSINRLARLISYGLPAVALGVIIFLAIPYHPTSIDQTNIVPDTEITKDSSQIVVETADEQASQSQDKYIIPKITPTTSSENTSKPLTQQDPIENTAEPIESVPMMLKTSSPIVGGDALSTPSLMTAKESQSLQPTTIVQQYTDEDVHLSYTIDISGEDLLLQGILDYCKQSYTITEPLVGVSANGTIIVKANTKSSTDSISDISLHFTDGLITKVEGLKKCE